MAKLGEGDPRWIVQERDDGVNVNSWHWTEKNLFSWAKAYLETTLKDVTLFNGCVITGVESVKGDVVVNNRKGKTLFFYELEIKLNWTMGERKGTIHIPELDSDYGDNADYAVKVSVDGKGDAEADRIAAEIKAKGIPVVKDLISRFIAELKDAHKDLFKKPLTSSSSSSPGGSAPATPPASASSPSTATTATATTTVKTNGSTATANAAPQAPKLRGGTATIEMRIDFRAPMSEIFECLVDQRRVEAYTGGAATISREAGKPFSLFGGHITGENIEVVPPRRLVQRWRFSSWPEGHYSIVTFELSESKDGTTLKLRQEGVPAEDKERTEVGWRQNFWERIKMMFGYGGPASF